MTLELFKIGFLPVTIIDILDILMVSFIVYRSYLFIRGSRAAQMGVGLAIIFLIYVIASLFHMSAMIWLFQNLKTVWLVAFVILFQPELRRMLIHLGQSRFVRFFVKVRAYRPVEEVARAAVELSERGYGGLFVMARDVGLKSIVETGLVLSAEVSAPLIVAIFNPRSPLHDGAIVIQSELIQAAKCILPLSSNPDVPPELGTRHRAALGLSEETDAIVVIVSEETGQISIALNGQLIRGLDYESLKRRLIEEFELE